MAEERNPYATPDANLDSGNTEETQNDGPKGLGGWLILVTLGIVIGPLFKIFILTSVYFPLFSSGQAMSIFDTDPGLGALIQFEAIGHILLLAASLYLAFIFFTKKENFPRWFIGVTLATLAFIAIDTLSAPFLTPEISFSEPDHFKDLAQTAISAAIWIPYMLKSKRVRNTFVN